MDEDHGRTLIDVTVDRRWHAVKEGINCTWRAAGGGFVHPDPAHRRVKAIPPTGTTTRPKHGGSGDAHVEHELDPGLIGVNMSAPHAVDTA